MSRAAGLIALAAAALFAAVPALATPFENCGPETVTAHYSEQICYRGEAGYVACRWVPRSHEVTIPSGCEAAQTGERAVITTRGAYRGEPARR